MKAHLPALLLCALLGVGFWTYGRSDEPTVQKALTGEDAKQANALDASIGTLVAADKYDEAIGALEKLLALRTRLQGAEHWEVVELRWQMTALKKVGALNKAQRQEWAQVLAQARGSQQLMAQGRLKEAEAANRKALEFHRQVLGENHPDTSGWYHNVAHVLNDQSRLAEAEELFAKGLAIILQTLGPSHPTAALCYEGIGENLSEQGRYADAERHQRKALAILQKVYSDGNEHVAICCGNLARTLDYLGRHSEAGPLHQKTLAGFEARAGKDHQYTNTARNNYALNLGYQGRHGEAVQMSAEALASNLRRGGEGNVSTAITYKNHAGHLDDAARNVEAESFHRKALAIRAKLLGDKHPETAKSKLSLAHNLNVQRRFAEAEPLFHDALSINQAVRGDRHPETASACENLAGNQLSLHRPEEAEKLYRQALATYEDVLGPNHPRTARCRNNLAASLNLQARYDEAGDLCKQSLDLIRRTLGEQHAETAVCHLNLATTLVARGRAADALPHWRSSSAILEAARLRVTSSGLGRAGFQNKFSSRIGLAAALAGTGEVTEAWQVYEGYLGRGLLDDVAAGQERTFQGEERERLNALNAELALLDRRVAALLVAKNGLEANRAKFDQIVQERTALQEELGRLAATLQQREIADLKTIQSSLPADVALVAWIGWPAWQGLAKLQDEHWACIVKSTGQPQWVRLPGTGANGGWTKDDHELPQMVARALEQPRNAAGVKELTRRLAQQRIEPLKEHLGDVRHLIVLPSLALAGIPVEAITDDFLISYAPSGTMLARLHARQRTKGKPTKFLAVGDPTFRVAKDVAIQTDSSTKPGYVPLPGARKEVEAIAALFSETEKLLGAEASRTRLAQMEKQLQQYDAIHLATHAVADPNVAFESALILSQTTDDGRLTAREIKDRWPLKAELVVLSACSSGMGQHAGGEGYLGFSQALFLAGARSLILSQRPVSDVATSLLMVRFYENWLGQRAGLTKPMSKVEALHEAKAWLRRLSKKEVNERIAALPEAARGLTLEIPKDTPPQQEDRPFAHPYYWSAFILIGDPN